MKLLDGEKIIVEAKPKRSLKTYRILRDLLTYSVSVLLMIVIFTFSFWKLFSGWTLVVGGSIFLIIFIYSYITQTLSFNKLHYWITNKRIIIQRGLIGDEERSILIERLGEVIVVETWLQKMFGIKILMLEIIGKRKKEVLPAFPNSSKTKQLLLELISKKRKAEKLTY